MLNFGGWPLACCNVLQIVIFNILLELGIFHIDWNLWFSVLISDTLLIGTLGKEGAEGVSLCILQTSSCISTRLVDFEIFSSSLKMPLLALQKPN